MVSLELTAVRAQPDDVNLQDSLDRVHDLEGEPLDAATWEAMVALARSVMGDGLDKLKEDRDWGSVQAWAGPTLIDVLWHGQAVNIWYSGSDDEEFYAVLNRLRDEGFTVTQGHDVAEVSRDVKVADLVAAQEAYLNE